MYKAILGIKCWSCSDHDISEKKTARFLYAETEEELHKKVQEFIENNTSSISGDFGIIISSKNVELLSINRVKKKDELGEWNVKKFFGEDQ